MLLKHIFSNINTPNLLNQIKTFLEQNISLILKKLFKTFLHVLLKNVLSFINVLFVAPRINSRSLVNPDFVLHNVKLEAKNAMKRIKKYVAKGTKKALQNCKACNTLFSINTNVLRIVEIFLIFSFRIFFFQPFLSLLLRIQLLLKLLLMFHQLQVML